MIYVIFFSFSCQILTALRVFLCEKIFYNDPLMIACISRLVVSTLIVGSYLLSRNEYLNPILIDFIAIN